MFAEECRRAIAACQRTGLDALAREVWRAYGADVLSAAEASELCEAIAARRAVPGPQAAPRRPGSRPRSSTSMERRRAWTASGWLPPAIAARFTMGEAAALGVVMAEVAMTGRCELSHGAVGGRAGVSVSTVKRALGEAKRLGLVAVVERRQTWCRNLPNVVTVAAADLRTWVATRGRGLRAARAMGGGVQIGTSPKSIFDSHVTEHGRRTRQEGSREDDGKPRRDYRPRAQMPLRNRAPSGIAAPPRAYCPT